MTWDEGEVRLLAGAGRPHVPPPVTSTTLALPCKNPRVQQHPTTFLRREWGAFFLRWWMGGPGMRRPGGVRAPQGLRTPLKLARQARVKVRACLTAGLVSSLPRPLLHSHLSPRSCRAPDLSAHL